MSAAPLEALRRSLEEASPRIEPPSRPLILSGAGPLGRRTLACCRAHGLPVLAMSDHRASVEFADVDGTPVLSHEAAAARYGGSAAFVVTTYNTAALWRRLLSLGASQVLSYRGLYAARPDVFLPFMHLEGPDALRSRHAAIEEACSLFDDPESRWEFVRQTRARLQLDVDTIPEEVPRAVRESEYFPDGLYRRLDDEVFVDGGAFQGDTLERFLARWGGRFRAAHAVEPDPANANALDRWRCSLPADVADRIRVHRTALGAREGTARFDAQGAVSSSATDTGGLAVRVSALDDLIADTVPTLVKLDLEGGELEALRGAGRVLRESAPVMAVTVYHRADHLWTLPLQLVEAQPQYRLFLRAHAESGWDASVYAVVPDRIM